MTPEQATLLAIAWVIQAIIRAAWINADIKTDE